MKKRPSKSPVRKQWEKARANRYDTYPHYDHEVRHYYFLGRQMWEMPYIPPSYLDQPKQKRAAWTYRYYYKSPKYWRKLYSIRPFRRANKKFCRQTQTLAKSKHCDCEEKDLYIKCRIYESHIFEGLALPLATKPHNYYW